MYTAGLEGVGLANDSPVIADQIDNEKRPQLAPGRSGWWEGNEKNFAGQQASAVKTGKIHGPCEEAAPNETGETKG